MKHFQRQDGSIARFEDHVDNKFYESKGWIFLPDYDKKDREEQQKQIVENKKLWTKDKYFIDQDTQELRRFPWTVDEKHLCNIHPSWTYLEYCEGSNVQISDTDVWYDADESEMTKSEIEQFQLENKKLQDERELKWAPEVPQNEQEDIKDDTLKPKRSYKRKGKV